MRKLQLIPIIVLTLMSQITFGQRPLKVSLNNEASTLNVIMTKDFTDRSFIRGLVMFRNKIEQLAGSLIILGENDRAEIIGQYIKYDQAPIKVTPLSNVLYSSKINNHFGANGSYMIASLSASTNSIIELIVTDISGVIVPEESIPFLEICKASKNVDKDVKKNIYYIRSVKLSSVHSKSFTEANAATAISGLVFSVDGKAYKSSDQFKIDYVVSVDMVSLNNLLITRNCEDIITSNELAIRQAAEKAKHDSEQADIDKKIKENELNAAKAEVISLKNNLFLFQEALRKQEGNAQLYKHQADSLNKILAVAEKKVKKVTDEVVLAENQVMAMDSINTKLNNLDDKGKLIQKSSALEIKEIKQLTDEEIKKLGFTKINNN